MKLLLQSALVVVISFSSNLYASECAEAGKRAGVQAANQFINTVVTQTQYTSVRRIAEQWEEDCRAELSNACRASMWQTLFTNKDVAKKVQNIDGGSFLNWETTINHACSEEATDDWGSQASCPMGTTPTSAKFCSSTNGIFVVIDGEAWRVIRLSYSGNDEAAKYRIQHDSGTVMVAEFARLPFVTPADQGSDGLVPLPDW